MRGLVAISLAGVGILASATAALAQVPIYDQWDDIWFGRVRRSHPLLAPEVNIDRQYEIFEQFRRDYYEQDVLSKPLIYTPDLTNPFNNNLSNTSGFYRLTGTEPTEDIIDASTELE